MMPDKLEKEIAILDARSVYCVIVTYGDRFHFLKQVIDACLKEDVEKIVVVDNNSKSSEKLKELEKTLGNRLKVIYLEKNTGSAGGYKVGIEEAYNDKNCQLILLLDDDNVICHGLIQQALNLWNYFKETSNLFALSFLRHFFINDLWTIKLGLVKKIDNNNFCGLHIRTAFLKTMRKYSKEYLKNKDTLFPITKATVAAYGGLFFHKDIISMIGFPNEKFFLYGDDYDFTYRITEKSGAIYLCAFPTITDVDWPPERKTLDGIHYFFQKDANEAIIYYSIRNRVFVGRKHITNYLVYGLNLAIWFIYYCIFLYLIAIKKVNFKLYKRRVKLFYKAIIDGYKKDLENAFFDKQELNL